MGVAQFGTNQKYAAKLHRGPDIQRAGDSFIEGYSSDDEVRCWHFICCESMLNSARYVMENMKVGTNNCRGWMILLCRTHQFSDRGSLWYHCGKLHVWMMLLSGNGESGSVIFLRDWFEAFVTEAYDSFTFVVTWSQLKKESDQKLIRNDDFGCLGQLGNSLTRFIVFGPFCQLTCPSVSHCYTLFIGHCLGVFLSYPWFNQAQCSPWMIGYWVRYVVSRVNWLSSLEFYFKSLVSISKSFHTWIPWLKLVFSL